MIKIEYITDISLRGFKEELERFINNNVECKVYYINHSSAFVHYKEEDNGKPKSRVKASKPSVSKKSNNGDNGKRKPKQAAK